MSVGAKLAKNCRCQTLNNSFFYNFAKNTLINYKIEKMNRTIFLTFVLLVSLPTILCGKGKKDIWPDGKEIPDWFRDVTPTDISKLGKMYYITDYGVKDDGNIYTKELQALINEVANNGGGVIVVPKGTYRTGAIFFRQGTHLYIEESGILKGSDDISDFPVMNSRIEGESCKYFPGVVNADGIDGLTICGKGTIDGNGLRYWKAFWLRRTWNPQCTNKDEMRPRLVFISNCKNVRIEGLHLKDSPFWTTHIYRCENVKYLNLRITSPASPVKAPSTDAIDIDACKNVLVKGCYMSVNDDAIALKGGKGPWADDFLKSAAEKHNPNLDNGNGSNENIIIEDCEYGFCHGCLTCGSESVFDHNIILRRIKVDQASNLLWLKMRPDTPQRYEYITVEDIKGNAKNFLLVRPWTQFYDLKDRKDIPMSFSDHITMRNIDLECDVFFNVEPREDQYHLSNFLFENLNIRTARSNFHQEYIENLKTENVIINN